MTEITTYETLQAALNALAPELADRAAEMDDARRLPADLAGKMAAAGAFRMMTPKTYGGLELTAREFIEGVEQIARANASAGWCCMIACTTSMNAAYMAPDMATEIYADPLTITGGVFARWAGLTWKAMAIASPGAGNGAPAQPIAAGWRAAAWCSRMAS